MTPLLPTAMRSRTALTLAAPDVDHLDIVHVGRLGSANGPVLVTLIARDD